MTTALLEIVDLTVRHGAVTALDGVSLTVAAGEAVALVGANGAGKSSLMRAVMGLSSVASGTIRLDGAALDALPTHVRVARGLGYCPEGRRVFPGMTVMENLEVASAAPPAARAAAMARMLDLFPALRPKARDAAWQLSGGQQQMLAIARALMTAPRLLLLDEPSLGLSPRLVQELFAAVRAIAADGTAILLAEQNVAQALAITRRATVLALGRVAAAGESGPLRDDPALCAAFLGG